MTLLDDFFREAANEVDRVLERLVPSSSGASSNLVEAMRWSLFAGGKRLRPALVYASGRAFGADDRSLAKTAAAVEMLHTYSLIHDDLPAMDDDDLRRGRETSHKKFGEATAILAGDALQALAFQTIAEDDHLTPAVRLDLISGLGKAAACMVAGQHSDLEAEGKAIGLSELEVIHSNKTGALISFSLRAGALKAHASDDDIRAVTYYGETIGLLFQVVDDVLDVTQPTETLGKTAGKDAASAKSTYPSLMGLEASRKLAAGLCREAVSLLPESVDSGHALRAIPEYLLDRSC